MPILPRARDPSDATACAQPPPRRGGALAWTGLALAAGFILQFREWPPGGWPKHSVALWWTCAVGAVLLAAGGFLALHSGQPAGRRA